MRIPDDHSGIESGIEVEGLSLRVSHYEAKDERSAGVPKRNSRDYDQVAGSEWLWGVVAERVVWVHDLDGRVGKGECLTVINLVDVLDVLVHSQATDISHGHAELEGAMRCPIYGDMKTVVAHKDVHLECVTWGGREGECFN